MLRIDEYGFDDSPRVLLLERRRSVSLPFAPKLLLHDSTYQKLPTQILINLSILKLDGSSFDVQIKRNAKVGELKQAVEDVFTLSSMNNQGLVSWLHVWGQFCLCYEGQKLINDEDYISSFLIRDGDQLHFIRHISVSYYTQTKGRAKKQNVACQKNMKLLAGSSIYSEREEIKVNGDIAEESHNQLYYYEDNEHGDLAVHKKSKLTNRLKGWLSHSRSRAVGRSRSKVHPTKFFGKFIKMGLKLTITSRK